MNDTIDLQQTANQLRESTENFLKKMEQKAAEINDREMQLNAGLFFTSDFRFSFCNQTVNLLKKKKRRWRDF